MKKSQPDDGSDAAPTLSKMNKFGGRPVELPSRRFPKRQRKTLTPFDPTAPTESEINNSQVDDGNHAR